ncbi:riboflavin biosynthesis protein RibF [Candidatus Daviesbacteria bacterium]|nr:riboflavin biosynthesis protein RibF [Candidatus Daviesbacteria bacterium]
MYEQGLRLRLKFWGKVRKANLRGKKLGFPTANMNLSRKIPEGIYISKARIAGVEYKSLTFIGEAKTFGEKKFQAETYILNFSRNLYDKWITVELFKKIRGNKKFKSAKDLVEQMKEDERKARDFFYLLTKR